MSTPETTADLSPKADRLRAYLAGRIESEGTFYEKSRYIAEEIDLSAKEIGALLRQLQQSSIQIRIEQWGYTNGTTWQISEA